MCGSLFWRSTLEKDAESVAMLLNNHCWPIVDEECKTSLGKVAQTAIVVLA